MTAPALAAFGALAGALSLLLWSRLIAAGPIDDAFITLRTARNWAAGLGPFFNPGEAVEATSSPLWTAPLALGTRLGADPLRLWFPLELLSAAGAGAAAALVAQACAGPLAALLAMAMLALVPSWNLWASTGMEVPLAGALLTLAALLAARAATVRAALATGLCLAGAVLARHECALAAPLLCALAALGVEKRARLGALALAGLSCLVPLLAFLLWRHATYGSWVPNTYVAKVEGGGWALREQGLRYAGHFVVLHAPLAAAALLAPRCRTALAAVAAIAAHLLAVFYAGGDHFAFTRLALPCLPLLVALAAAGLGRLPRIALRAALGGTLALSGLLLARPTGELQQMTREAAFAVNCAQAAQALAQFPDGLLATESIGALGYFTARPVLDLVGLADAHIACTPHIAGALSGHDHADNDYVLKRAPLLVLTLPLLAPAIWDEETERRRLHALHSYFAAGELLVGDARFRAAYQPLDVPVGPLHLRVWRRR